MSRLIDADALPNELFKKHVHDDEELEPMLYFEDAVKVVEDAPTIDAIPMEWLKQQRECNDPESVKDINGAFVSICIDGVLALWQKEQEAR